MSEIAVEHDRAIAYWQVLKHGAPTKKTKKTRKRSVSLAVE